VKIVLFQPQIPQNAGNIVRTCSVSGNGLVLVRPLGFSTANRHLKRAGLDYWEGVKVEFIDDLMSYLSLQNAPFYFFSSHSKTLYTEASYSDNALLIFGSETAGLPSEFHTKWPERFYTIPMRKESRCLNLANAVSIVIYEAWRQQQFT